MLFIVGKTYPYILERISTWLSSKNCQNNFDQSFISIFEEIQFKASTSQVAIIKLVLITVYRTKKEIYFSTFICLVKGVNSFQFWFQSLQRWKNIYLKYKWKKRFCEYVWRLKKDAEPKVGNHCTGQWMLCNKCWLLHWKKKQQCTQKILTVSSWIFT